MTMTEKQKFISKEAEKIHDVVEEMVKGLCERYVEEFKGDVSWEDAWLIITGTSMSYAVTMAIAQNDDLNTNNQPAPPLPPSPTPTTDIEKVERRH